MFQSSAKSVLVVDDDFDLGSLIVEILESSGYKAVHVGDGESALAAWRDGAFDLMIVDYAMPGMDGFQLLSALSWMKGGPVPSIMISGNPVVEVALRSGATAFLAKPFSMSQLLKQIAQVVQQPLAAMTARRPCATQAWTT